MDQKRLKDMQAEHITQEMIAAGLERRYIVQIGQDAAGKVLYTPTAKGVAQLAADILGGFVTQADAESFRDFTAEERAELRLHLEGLLKALERL